MIKCRHECRFISSHSGGTLLTDSSILVHFFTFPIRFQMLLISHQPVTSWRFARMATSRQPSAFIHLFIFRRRRDESITLTWQMLSGDFSLTPSPFFFSIPQIDFVLQKRPGQHHQYYIQVLKLSIIISVIVKTSLCGTNGTTRTNNVVLNKLTHSTAPGRWKRSVCYEQ